MAAGEEVGVMEILSVRRPAVGCIAWLDDADSQTKCNTDDVWREGKKKGLEGEKEWPEGGDEVSATGWGRTERAGGVADGGAEAGGDRAGAWAASEHGLARIEAQRGALRWAVSRRAGPAAGAARRYRSRRNSQFGRRQWERVEELLREEWSPEQVSGHLRLQGELAISHETIYRHIWRDLRGGGTLHEHLRGARKSCRKRYGRYDSRGRLAGKRRIWERPHRVEERRQTGHWEIDTMMGESQGESSHCVLTLVERKSGYLMTLETPGAHRGRNQPRLARAAGAPSGTDAHDHGGQRDRVPLVRRGGSGPPGQVLLRHPASQLGARDQ